MELEATFVCVYCFSVNEVAVDASGGRKQEYVEDCQVCCRPNVLRVEIDKDLRTAKVYAEIP